MNGALTFGVGGGVGDLLEGVQVSGDHRQRRPARRFIPFNQRPNFIVDRQNRFVDMAPEFSFPISRFPRCREHEKRSERETEHSGGGGGGGGWRTKQSPKKNPKKTKDSRDVFIGHRAWPTLGWIDRSSTRRTGRLLCKSHANERNAVETNDGSCRRVTVRPIWPRPPPTPSSTSSNSVKLVE